jgi:DNA-directed RNA polymerase subunit alpha
MFNISCKECRVEHPRSFYGCFVLGPFEVGQSLTVANTLRRTLLGDLPGVGVCSAEIHGASHEYSHLQGVQESMLDLLLNLKQLVFRPTYPTAYGDKLRTLPLSLVQTAYVHVRGPGLIQARHVQLPPSLQCVDPDQPIATLMEDGTLKAKCWLSWGTHARKPELSAEGTVTRSTHDLVDRERLKEERMAAFLSAAANEAEPQEMSAVTDLKSRKIPDSTGRFLFDTVFVPVQRVNYMIQPSEIWPNEHDIVLEIWTNGSLHPRQALAMASKQVLRLFSKMDRAVLWSKLTMQ